MNTVREKEYVRNDSRANTYYLAGAYAAAVSEEEIAPIEDSVYSKEQYGDFGEEKNKFMYRVIKRLFDIVCSGLALIVLSPFFLVIALIIKAEDPAGPVFFFAEKSRYGRQNHPHI